MAAANGRVIRGAGIIIKLALVWDEMLGCSNCAGLTLRMWLLSNLKPCVCNLVSWQPLTPTEVPIESLSNDNKHCSALSYLGLIQKTKRVVIYIYIYQKNAFSPLWTVATWGKPPEKIVSSSCRSLKNAQGRDVHSILICEGDLPGSAWQELN